MHGDELWIESGSLGHGEDGGIARVENTHVSHGCASLNGDALLLARRGVVAKHSGDTFGHFVEDGDAVEVLSGIYGIGDFLWAATALEIADADSDDGTDDAVAVRAVSFEHVTEIGLLVKKGLVRVNQDLGMEAEVATMQFRPDDVREGSGDAETCILLQH